MEGSNKKIITSYLLCVDKNREDKKLVDFTIVFLTNGNEFVKKTKYKKVEKWKLKKLKEMLDDYTSYNRKTGELCRTLSFETIVYQIDNLIYND